MTDLITKKTNEEFWPLLLPCLRLLPCVCRKWVEFDDFRRNQNNGQIVACQDRRINVVETFVWLRKARCYVVEIIFIEDYQGGEQIVKKLKDLLVSFTNNRITKRIHLNGVFVRNCTAWNSGGWRDQPFCVSRCISISLDRVDDSVNISRRMSF